MAEKLTRDSTIEQALQNEKAVELIEARIPGITKNPAIRMVKKFKLKNIISQLHMTEEELDQMLEEANAE